MIQKAKIYFKSKVEDQLANHDARSAWQGLNKMMGRDSKGVNNGIIDTDISRFFIIRHIHNHTGYNE